MDSLVDEMPLEATAHYFFTHNNNLRSIKRILIYGDENTDLLLKKNTGKSRRKVVI